jgi:hypothetical protein
MFTPLLRLGHAQLGLSLYIAIGTGPPAHCATPHKILWDLQEL